MAKTIFRSGTIMGAAALALTACAEPKPPTETAIPVAVAYPASSQQKMQAVQHWGVLAHEIARQVAPSLKDAGAQMYVPVHQPRSPFYDGFRGMLIEALVNQGVVVAAAPAGALVLNYDVQVVNHNAERTGFAGPSSDPPTSAEAIVSAEVVSGSKIWFKTNRTYYINPEDATAQYIPSGRPIVPTTARAVRVTN